MENGASVAEAVAKFGKVGFPWSGLKVSKMSKSVFVKLPFRQGALKVPKMEFFIKAHI